MKIQVEDLIEVPTPQCHAASIEYFKGGQYISWFGGTHEKHIDCNIFISVDSGEPFILRKSMRRIRSRFAFFPRWNPVLFNIKDKDLILFWKEGAFCDSWQGFYSTFNITDDKLGSKDHMMPAGIYGTVKNRPVIVGDKILCGSSVETMHDWVCYIEEFSFDKGVLQFKERSTPIFKSGGVRLLQPAIWYTDKLHALIRSNTGYIWYWEEGKEPVETDVMNPNSAVAVVHHSSGRLYLLYNPDSRCRHPLCMAEISPDEGKLIKSIKLIDHVASDHTRTLATTCVSYPYGVETPEGDIDIVYTYGRSKIGFFKINVD